MIMAKPKIQQRPDTRSFLLALLGLLFASCLAYGTSGVLVRGVVGLGVFLLLFLFLWFCSHHRLQLRKVPGFWPGVMLLGFCVLQILPLPPVLVSLLSPAAEAWYERTVWLHSPGIWMPLSLNPSGTLSFLLHFAMAFACYWLTCQLVTSKRHLNLVVVSLAIFASGYCLFSVVEKLYSNGRILWIFAPWPAGERRIGTFINPNHFAGWLGMLLPVYLAKYVIYRPSFGWSGHWRDRLLDLFDGGRFSRTLLYGLVCLLLAIGIVLSQSRGGFICTVAALMVLLAGLMTERMRRSKGVVVFVLLSLTTVIISWFGWEPLWSRFLPLLDRGAEAVQRLRYWQDSFLILLDYPLLGSGFGSFVDIYGPYQSVATGSRLVDHAHNDLIEFLIEGGLLGVSILVAAAWNISRCCTSAFSRRRTRATRQLVWGVFAGVMAALFHSLFDFGLRLGAPALLFALLCGLLVVLTHLRMAPGNEASTLPTVPFPKAVGPRFALAAGLILLLCGITTQVAAGFLGQPLLSAEHEKVADTENRSKIQIVRTLDPLNAEWLALAGRIESRAGNQESAATMLRVANRKRPLNRIILQDLGELLIRQGGFDSGFQLLRTGAEQERMFPDGWRRYALLLSQTNPEESLPIFMRAITLEPKKTRYYVMLMILQGLSHDQIEQALPGAELPWMAYGNYRLELGDEDAAEESYRTAIRYALSSAKPSAAVFSKYAAFLVSRQRMAEAVDLLEMGCDLQPNNPGLLLLYAKYSEVVGLVRQARDSYQRVLMLRPGHVEARRRLEHLEKEWTTL